MRFRRGAIPLSMRHSSETSKREEKIRSVLAGRVSGYHSGLSYSRDQQREGLWKQASRYETQERQFAGAICQRNTQTNALREYTELFSLLVYLKTIAERGV
jgi:hypothetical protein